MKIVSVTIAHNREHAIAGALACVVPFVDEVLILDTGITDRTLDVARETVGDKLRFFCAKWQNDFSQARNAVLDFAAERGADWAIMIDTDQRIDWAHPHTFQREDFEIALERLPPPVSCFTMRAKSGRFVKEQIFRIPRRGAYTGRTHEAFTPTGGCREFPLARVWGLEKSPEEMRAKLDRDREILLEDADTEPENGRTWFYLGETLAALEERDGAILAHTRAYETSKRLAEAAWSAYRIGQLSLILERHDDALAWCQRGLSQGPLAELAALAGWISYRKGAYNEALSWCEKALHLGDLRRHAPTSHFRDWEAYYEGPAGLAALLCGVLGDLERSQKYELEKIRLRALRLQEVGSPS